MGVGAPGVTATFVPSIRAERRVALIMATAAQYRRLEAVIGPSSRLAGRIRRTVVPAEQVRAQAALFRVTSIIEAFAVEEIVLRVEPNFPAPRNVVVESVYVDAENKALATWSSIQEHYKQWLQITFSQSDGRWNNVKSLVEARNAIAHGVGELTRRQSRSRSLANTVRDLGVLGISVGANGSLYIAADAVGRASRIAREFIHWLDDQLQKYDAGARLPAHVDH
jgi:hypothetical protein